MRSFPPDVLVLDNDSLLHARLGRGAKTLQLTTAKSYRLASDTFSDGVVSPAVANEPALAETLRRLRMETGRWDKASLLLPDSWFRMNMVEVPSLPDRANEAQEIVRWSLRRTLPIPAESLRIAYEVMGRTPTATKLLVVSAVEKTLETIERLFSAAGIDLVLIEPVGLNLWNAIAARQQTIADRLFVYVREREFTTGVFRGAQPVFLRSRNLSGERSLQQEIRLSATYLRDSVGAANFETCFVAGRGASPEIHAVLASEFNAPVRAVSLREFAEGAPADMAYAEAELAACTGVFTA
jgi:Tfp pilus assembly PilM family ATPase